MFFFYWICGIVLGTVWLWKALETFFGLPKVDDITEPQWSGENAQLPSLSVVVPARNEGAQIKACVTSLLALDYPQLEIIAIDDRSTDSTGSQMDELADLDSRLRVIHVTELPAGWLGKTHAMWKGASIATGEWLLFTDGDIVFRPDALRRALYFAMTKRSDHLVVLVTIIMGTFGERMMMAFFVNNLVFLHRLWKVSDPKAKDFTGTGAFNLVRRSVYEAIGTYSSMRLEIIDDLALGKKVKSNGFSQFAALGDGLLNVRWAVGAIGVAHNLTKNVYALVKYNPMVLVGAVFGSIFIGLGPLLGLLFAPGLAKIGYAAALASIAGVYVVMKKVTQVSPLYFFTQPIACVLMVYTLLRSMLVTVWNGGVIWRGTKYSLDELRAK